MLNNAVVAGKRVRSETAISKGSVSVSSAAVELSEMKSVPDLQIQFSEARLAVIGAGKMTWLLIAQVNEEKMHVRVLVSSSCSSCIQICHSWLSFLVVAGFV
jgi:glutamyl-tRNA reductase